MSGTDENLVIELPATLACQARTVQVEAGRRELPPSCGVLALRTAISSRSLSWEVGIWSGCAEICDIDEEDRKEKVVVDCAKLIFITNSDLGEVMLHELILLKEEIS